MSTYILRGFISYPELIDNSVGTVAPLGELSKHALTFSRETGIYKETAYPGVQLYTFDSREEGVGMTPVPDSVKSFVLQFGRHILQDAKAERYSDDSNVTQARLNQDFGTLITELNVGAMATDGALWLPEWVSFRLRSMDSYIRLWFANDAFEQQYSQYEYAFIAPVANLDDLHANEAQVEAALAQQTYGKITEAIEQERGAYPYTHLMVRGYPWVSGDLEKPMDWTILIYGSAGTDLDRIRIALSDWIVANSSYTREEWLPVLPDIFAPTEFIISPLWHQYAIPNKTVQAGIHSPIVAIADVDSVTRETLKGVGYNSTERFANTVVTGHPYKSLALLITGSAANRDGKHRINQHFPDYIAITQQNPDFARMEPVTQEWVRRLSEMFRLAESMTTTSPLPSGYYRVYREGVLYLGRDYQNILYLMVSRLSHLALFGPNEDINPDIPDPGLDDSEKEALLTTHLNATNPHEMNIGLLSLPAEMENAELITVYDVRLLLEE